MSKIDFIRPKSMIHAVVEASMSLTSDDVAQGRFAAAQTLVELADTGKFGAHNGTYSVKECYDHFCDVSLDAPVEHVAEAVTSSHFPYITSKALGPGSIKEYQDGLAGAEILVTEVPGTTDLRDVPIPGMTAVEGLSLVHQGEDYPYTDLEEKYVLIKMFKFGRIVDLTREAISRDKTGFLITRVNGLSKRAGTLRHQIIVQKATGVACTATEEGATSNFRYNGSAAAIFSDDHSAIDGYANDNISTTAFGTAGIEALYNLVKAQKDEAGERINTMVNTLMVPIELHVTALKLLRSAGQYDTANRTDNVLPELFGTTPKIFTSPVLSDNSATKYYLGAPKEQTVWVWEYPFKVDTMGANSSEAFKRDIVFQTKVSFAGSAGCTDHRFLTRGGT